MNRQTACVVLPLTLILGACAVPEAPDRVAVTHTAQQDIVGKWAAETYCAKQGRKPKLVKVSPVVAKKTSLYFRTKTSTYICVEDPPQ